MRRTAGERGGVTAEFAAALPAVILVLACCLAALQLGTQHLRLQDAAAIAARSAARGDPVDALSPLMPGASLRVTHRGDLVCVTAATRGTETGAGLLAAVSLSASSCALDEGR